MMTAPAGIYFNANILIIMGLPPSPPLDKIYSFIFNDELINYFQNLLSKVNCYKGGDTYYL